MDWKWKCTGYFEIEVCTDTAKFMNVVGVRFWKCADLIGDDIKAKVANKMGCVESGVVYFSLLFKSSKKKFSFRRVES